MEDFILVGKDNFFAMSKSGQGKKIGVMHELVHEVQGQAMHDPIGGSKDPVPEAIRPTFRTPPRWLKIGSLEILVT